MIVLQQGCGTYEPLLDVVEPLNAAKCEAAGCEYRPIRTQRLKGHYKPHEKYLWILDALEVDEALWIDADGWICGNEGLNQLDGADIAGVRNGSGEINTGVVWFRRSGKVIEFLLSVIKCMERREPWSEQWLVNQMLPYSKLSVRVLDSRWNAYRNVMHRPTKSIQIWTCHDMQQDVGRKIKQMNAAIRGAA